MHNVLHSGGDRETTTKRSNRFLRSVHAGGSSSRPASSGVRVLDNLGQSKCNWVSA